MFHININTIFISLLQINTTICANMRPWLMLITLLSTLEFCALLAISTSTPTTSEQSSSLSSSNTYELDSFKAIRSLHTKLDVDADGEVDDSESKKFLESDKIKVSSDKNVGAYSTAHKLRYLHQDGKDRSISVDELWEAWKTSQVHNWTVDETIYWLVNYVELPEYSRLFEAHSVNGSLLPRLATDSYFVSKIGITDPSAKSKISIKAMDVVLFGPPKLGNAGKVRDIIVTIVIMIALSSCYVFYSRSRASQKALQEMQDKLESLQRAEDQMLELQNELNKALKTQEANDSSADKKFRAPYHLKNLLQKTYNIESQHHEEKKLRLESKATEVKLRNQKLQKKKTTFLGLYKMAQENSLEDDINTIVEVKEAIMQVTKEVKERTERWRGIEELCGISITTNSEK